MYGTFFTVIHNIELQKGVEHVAQINNTWGNYSLDYFLFPSQHFDQFNQYMEKYGGMTDSQIYNEINIVKGQVSPEVIRQHTANLDAIAQLQGFVDNHTRQRIARTKEVLASNVGSNSRYVESQYFGGSSLLLWFLLLVSIWRRPFGGGWFW